MNLILNAIEKDLKRFFYKKSLHYGTMFTLKLFYTSFFIFNLSSSFHSCFYSLDIWIQSLLTLFLVHLFPFLISALSFLSLCISFSNFCLLLFLIKNIVLLMCFEILRRHKGRKNLHLTLYNT